MKKLLVFIALLGGLWFILSDQKPEWFLKAITKVPFIDTSLNVDFLSPNVGLTEELLSRRYDHLLFVCDKEASKLGDRVCWVYLSTFNQIAADMAAFFFKEGTLSHLRVTFPGEAHPKLLSYLNDNYRKRGVSNGSREMFGQDLGLWLAKTGTLAAYREAPKPGNMNMLLWTNKNVYLKERE